MEKQIKKSAVDLTDLAIGVIVLGVVVSVGAYMLITFRDARLSDMSVVTLHNETTPTVTETGAIIGDPDGGEWGISVTRCINSTTDEIIDTNNYSAAVGDGGTITITYTGTTGHYNDTAWRCTFTAYNTSQADWQLANKSALGIGEFGNWFKIIVIVGIAAVVLSLIFLAFGRRGEEGPGGSY